MPSCGSGNDSGDEFLDFLGISYRAVTAGSGPANLRQIKTQFDSARMDRSINQTRTRNVAVNRILDRYVPIAETRYIERPDGVALPGEFHLRYVFRKDIPVFFGIANAATRT
jgi:hypothetical protein